MPSDLPFWEPNQPPLYNIDKTYLENVESGPVFHRQIPERLLPSTHQWIDFLGHKVASPIGVPAGPLLSSSWICLAATLGFDILVYKTIRSQAHPAHPLPNMVYVDTHGAIAPHHVPPFATRLAKPTSHLEALAVTNSFGMPSMTPKFLLEDIPKANASLHKGQVMIVSVAGTVRSHCTFLEDFIAAARLAKDAGAQIIEANFSCPNVDKSAGCLYMSPTTVYEIGYAISKAIAPLPLIIKVGHFSSLQQMRAVFQAAAKANIRAISGINTISMAVVDSKGQPALSANRPTSGICGGPIRNLALHFVKDAAAINCQDKLDLTIIGVGGITLPEHFAQFFNAGAHIAMSATGMMWDPYLATRYHRGLHAHD